MGDTNQEYKTGDEAPRETSGRQPGWNAPQPEVLPKPTYTPAIMSFGIIFLLWGLVTSWVLFAVGFILIAIALIGWIGAIRNE